MSIKIVEIKPLSQFTISHIAAGEVIDRPAAALKELIENALDAGATAIKIELENGGLDLIRVSDNGHGIPRSQLELSVLNHTTSKLHSIDDLNHLHTFGFRGEALASLAVSGELEIASRTPGESSGFRFNVTTGQIEPFGMPPGTIVTLRTLFGELPARRKFLSQPRHEWTRCLETITQLTLIHPTVAWSVYHNKKQVLELPAVTTLKERAQAVLPKTIVESFLPVSLERSVLTVSGLITLPTAVQKRPIHQYWYINRRAINHPILQEALKTAYHHHIDSQTFPPVIINIQLPPGLIDPNVHPQKSTVGFIDPEKMQSLIIKALTEALAAQPIAAANFEMGDESLADLTQPRLHNLLKSITKTWSTADATTGEVAPPLFQAEKLYLITTTPRGVFIIDQRAAHERILYEQFLASFQEKKAQAVSTQTLSPAPTLHLSVKEESLMNEALPIFTATGFTLEPFGQRSYRLTTIPDHLDSEHALQVVSEVFQDLNDGQPVSEVDSISKRTIAYLACRSAVKAGDSLTTDQQHNLLEKLLQTPRHETCPHGRPTHIEITWEKITRLFKRA